MTPAETLTAAVVVLEAARQDLELCEQINSRRPDVDATRVLPHPSTGQALDAARILLGGGR